MRSRYPFETVLWVVSLHLLMAAGPCHAFHSGGTGDCGGCHDMHRPAGGSGTGTGGNPHFLIAADAGSTCLACHQATGENRPNGHLVSTADADMPPGTPPVQLTPGGDFGWLKKSYRWEAGDHRGAGSSPGERHGHSIVASVFGYLPDTVLTTAPGGSYPSSALSCISCHDPHGQYRRFADGSIGNEGAPILSSGSYDNSAAPGAAAVGVYRLLGGKGYATIALRYLPFTSDPPAAVAPADYNREEAGYETRVAYGSGMSEWCANCHPALIAGAEGARGHPSGKTVRLSPAITANYNSYVASGNMTGSRSTAYTSMVPYEMGTADYDLLKQTANANGRIAAGPDPNAGVACLSCHRAHASGWDHAARWNMKTEFLVYNGEYPGIEDTNVPPGVSQGRTRPETRRTFYGRPPTRYAMYQRSLCNKCHAKD